MIKCLLITLDEVVDLNTHQFIEGVIKGDVMGFHIEDYGPLSFDERSPGHYGLYIRSVLFTIHTDMGDVYWVRSSKSLDECNFTTGNPKIIKRQAIDRILKDLGIGED